MKKLLALMLAGAMALSMVACGEKTETTPEVETETTPVVTDVAVADFVGEYTLVDGKTLTIAEDATFTVAAPVVETEEVVAEDAEDIQNIAAGEVVATAEVETADTVVISETEGEAVANDVLLIAANPTTAESTTTEFTVLPEGTGVVALAETEGVITATFTYDAEGGEFVATVTTEGFDFGEYGVATKVINEVEVVDDVVEETTEETTEEVVDEVA